MDQRRLCWALSLMVINAVRATGTTQECVGLGSARRCRLPPVLTVHLGADACANVNSACPVAPVPASLQAHKTVLRGVHW